MRLIRILITGTDCDYNGNMETGSLSRGKEQRWVDQRWRLPWWGRTLVILLPLHLAAFVLLYFGVLLVVQTEILEVHSHGARMLLQEAIKDVHPFMVAGEGRGMGNRLDEFVDTHAPVNLQLFGHKGVEIGRTAAPNSKVTDFLSGSPRDLFEVDRRGSRVLLHGMMKIDSTGRCTSCHQEGEILGVASMNLDITPYMESTNRRLGKGLAVLLVGWTIMVGAFNFGVTRLARRRAARLKRILPSKAQRLVGVTPGVTEFMLDPVSAELYASLRDVLEQQREREQDIASRLQHTERLAFLGRVSAGLAHEIKNPLAGIHGALELLLDESTEESQRFLFRRMLQELERVNQTLQSLLRYAKPTEPDRVPTDVSKLLNDSVSLLRPSLKRRNIAIDIFVASQLPPVAMDRDQIRQVIVNIVGNAADAIEGTGAIAIRASQLPDDGSLVIAISDNGVGIPEERLEEIFEPFYTSKFSGTGLGLATARGFVQNHGGRLAVESTLGRGSTFYILLPRQISSTARASDRSA